MAKPGFLEVSAFLSHSPEPEAMSRQEEGVVLAGKCVYLIVSTISPPKDSGKEPGR